MWYNTKSWQKRKIGAYSYVNENLVQMRKLLSMTQEELAEKVRHKEERKSER